MKVKVYAKLNLTLNVGGVYNGYHLIDSVASSIDIYDIVEVNERLDGKVTVSGLQQVDTERNTAYRAACGFVRQFNSRGVDIVIDKRIPMGAGLGGSSADAAAVVYCMCKLFQMDVNDKKVRSLCAAIGSDVNFMLRGGLARLRGKGDDITFSQLGAPLYFALTLFDTPMSTAEVFSRLDKLNFCQAHINNSDLLSVLNDGKVNDSVHSFFNNHLQAAASSLSDYAVRYLNFCKSVGFNANMTGSGSAYYVTCGNEHSAGSVAAALNENGFKTVVCKSVSCGIEIA